MPEALEEAMADQDFLTEQTKDQQLKNTSLDQLIILFQNWLSITLIAIPLMRQIDTSIPKKGLSNIWEPFMEGM